MLARAGMRRFLQRSIPRPVRVALRRLLYLPVDALSALRGQAGRLTPPRGLISVEGDYEAIGGEFLGYLKELCALQPDGCVLDVGCGVGRMAVPLTGYLSPSGRYEGFDIIRDGIAWCTRAITPRFPNFRFRHIDVFNTNYNRRGRLRAADLRFPYPDSSFDAVLAASVFTHMLPDDTENYLSEIARVLKPGGRSLLTFFMAEDIGLSAPEAVAAAFPHPRGVYRVHDPRTPEVAVCYSDEFVLSALEHKGLRLVHPLHRGSWSGRADFLSFQDIVVASRRNSPST